MFNNSYLIIYFFFSFIQNNIKCYYGKVKNVVLGCTHYPLIQKEIKDVLGEVKFFNGAQKLAEHLKILMKKNKSINNSNKSLEFIDSQKSKIKEKRFYKILEEFN